MARKRMIVPIFIPHEGCPYRCVFCNQDEITGASREDDFQRVDSTLKEYLKGKDIASLPPIREVAFYGGTFTGISAKRQEYLLGLIGPYIEKGWIHKIRVSTHARFVNQESLDRLQHFHVKTVELGVQSTNEEVLRLAGRIDEKQTLPDAIRMIRGKEFDLGLQIMLGLPGDDEATFLQTVRDVMDFKPDFVRIYPTLVIRNTPLHKLYDDGDYRPWSLERTVEVLKVALQLFEGKGIRVIRLGLHPEPSLLENLIDGPYHPSLRSLVDSALCFDEMSRLAGSVAQEGGKMVTFAVPWNRISQYVGHKRSNIIKLKQKFGFEDVLLSGRKELMSAQCN